MPDRPPLRSVLSMDSPNHRVLVADGAMGTMLQRYDLTAQDFDGFEGCNEMLNVTRPDLIAEVHRAYCAAGADLIEANTFGANLTALAEYGLGDRLGELAKAGAMLARRVCDEQDRPVWVLGSMGPGTKLASLGQVTYAQLRDGYHAQASAMMEGGIDAVQIETSQDLLAVRAAVAGARRAMADMGHDLPIFVSVTMETTGSMLVGSDISAVVATLVPLGVDAIGLNCATGPEQMSDHLRQLSRTCPTRITCMPNAGLPQLINGEAVYPLGADEFATVMTRYTDTFDLAVVGGCCGTTPEHIAALAQAIRGLDARPVRPERPDNTLIGPGWVASAYSATSLRQDVSYLSMGERTNAAGSKAFREAMLGADWDRCIQIARQQVSEGAHVIDLCVDWVGRDGREDMAALAARISREVDAPIQFDSSDPSVMAAGLQVCPGRAIVNSVNMESGTGPGSKFAATMALVREHGSAVVALCIDERGQARTTEDKVAVARRLISILQDEYQMSAHDIIIDCLTFPISTGHSDTRRDAVHTIEAISALRTEFPQVHTVLGVSNVSFGLKPPARVVLNSVFLDQARKAGLDCAIVHPSKILPVASIPAEQLAAALDVIWARGDDPLGHFLAQFDQRGVTEQAGGPGVERAALPVRERVRHHILDGVATDLDATLAEALTRAPAVDIINDDLLGAMREVGQRFGSGKMQLPFVLKSAEVMKRAVTILQPHLDKVDQVDKGTIVLATVRGDVHDIGKNLVDIILTNNGYRVVNLGIKQPIADIISAAEQVGADAIGLSGLLVKSTQVMAENLEELNERGLAKKYPVLLGGAALTRDYVERDLSDLYQGEVHYARDAFEGLRLMDQVVNKDDAAMQTDDTRHVGTGKPDNRRSTSPAAGTRSSVTRPIPGEIPDRTPPFFGPRQARANLEDVWPFLDHRALFAGQWGLKASAGGPSYEEVVAQEGRPRLHTWRALAEKDDLFDCRAVWGYWPCYSSGEDLVILSPEAHAPIHRLSFPRQGSGQHLCLADYFRDEDEAARFGPDVVAFQVVTVGEAATQRTGELFADHEYRDYFELHGLSVQLAEALAEFWHLRVRDELGLPHPTSDSGGKQSRPAYIGQRFSFGYPACPDLEQRRVLVDLLHPDSIGVTLSEECQLHPEQSTDALIVHHPQAHYFSAR